MSNLTQLKEKHTLKLKAVTNVEIKIDFAKLIKKNQKNYP